MATLKLDEPLRSREPLVDVAGDLPIGSYVVRLVVETANGRSLPAEMTLHVVRSLNPLDPRRPLDPIQPLDPFRPT